MKPLLTSIAIAATLLGTLPHTAVAGGKAKHATAHHEPNIASAHLHQYHCELGNNVAVYKYNGDSQRIAIRWKNKLKELHRVPTSTGAHRFENREAGLLWIDIPAKGMLLDSKKGKQLANECKSSSRMIAMND